MRKKVGENHQRSGRAAGPEAGGGCEAGEGSGGTGGAVRCLWRRARRSTGAAVAIEADEGCGELPELAEGRVPQKRVRAGVGGAGGHCSLAGVRQ